MSEMKAAYIVERPKIGELENKIRVDSTTIPAPKASDLKPDEILVEVKAFSINVDDIHVAEASFLGGLPKLQSVVPSIKKPLVVGSDFAGIIKAVGSAIDANKYKVGLRVCGLNHRQAVFAENGTWAEYTVTKAKSIVPVPDTISFVNAAAVVLPLFVIDGLLEVVRGKIGEKEKVLVVGASGGIGSMLIKMLRAVFADFDLDITGVCSGRNKELVLKMGANCVVDYTKGPIEASLEKKSYDVVFDCVGGTTTYKSSKAILRKGGRFITCVGPEEWIGDKMSSATEKISWVGKIIWYSVILNLIPGSHPHYHMVAPSEMGKNTFILAFEKEILPYVEKSVPFDNVGTLGEAFKLVRSHRVRGKVVFVI